MLVFNLIDNLLHCSVILHQTLCSKCNPIIFLITSLKRFKPYPLPLLFVVLFWQFTYLYLYILCLPYQSNFKLINFHIVKELSSNIEWNNVLLRLLHHGNSNDVMTTFGNSDFIRNSKCIYLFQFGRLVKF